MLHDNVKNSIKVFLFVVLTFGWEGCSSSEESAVAEADRLRGLAMLFWMLEQRLGDGEVPLEN
jgi:hypothetical protein